jgi:hypothetical protein
MPVPKRVRETYRENLQLLLGMEANKDEAGKPAPYIFKLDDDARAELTRLGAWLEPQLDQRGQLGHMTDWAGKLVGAVARIAGILHAASDVVDPAMSYRAIPVETAKSAIAIGHYLLAHAQAAYGEMGADESIDGAEHLLNWILRSGARASQSERPTRQPRDDSSGRRRLMSPWRS